MDLALWEYAALILAGIVAGFINVMAGGGSIITVPIMMFLGVPGPVANGTNRLPIVAQNISACLTYLRHGVPELRLALSLALCAVPGAIAGALLGVTISVEAFNIVLAGVMALVLILILTNAGSQESHVTVKPSRKRLAAGHGLMILAGFWGGVEAKKRFLDVLGRVVAELAIPKDEQFPVCDDGSTRAVEVIFPELGIGARCPSVGKIGLVGGAILIRTTPVEPPGDISDGG